jgi:hypothetical protein
VFDFKGQRVWARQINPERNNPEIRNDGGDLWILGFKTEFANINFHTLNGGRTEVLGGTMNNVIGEGNLPPAILNENSQVSVVCGTTDVRAGRLGWRELIRETRGEHTRVMRFGDLPAREGQMIALPLYVGRADEERQS